MDHRVLLEHRLLAEFAAKPCTSSRGSEVGHLFGDPLGLVFRACVINGPVIIIIAS